MSELISRQLKPCPFCGGTAIVDMDEYCFWDWHAWCFNCGCDIGHYATEEEAIEEWNKRAEPPADQWIPCSERLPIHNTLFPQKVFVTYVEDSVRYTAKAWLNMDGKWANLSNGEYFDEGSVVAWMPLPEPYKGE